MKYLIILILVITSCTDKKQIAEPIVVEPIIAEEKAVINIEPTIIIYDDSLDLMLIDSTPQEEYLSGDMISYYRSLYQDLESDQQYLANLKIISNISYTIDSNYIEKQFNDQLREHIFYIGNISKFQRVYKGKWNDQFYVKTLTPYKDEYYIEVISYRDKTYITNELTSPVFPYSINAEGSYGVTYYTNTDGIEFSRNWNFYKHEGTELISY